MRSIRLQLMLWCGGAIALMLAMLGIGLYLTLNHSLESRFNDSLSARATLLVNTLDWDPHRGLHVIAGFTPAADGKTQGTPRYFQIWTTGGKQALRASALGDRELKFLIPPDNGGVLAAVDLPNDHAGRELVIRFRAGHGDEDQHDPQHDGPGHVGDGQDDSPDHGERRTQIPRHYILAVARPTDDLDGALLTIGWSLVICCSLVTLCSAVLIAWLLHRGLRPVDTIAEQIAGVGATDIKERISAENIPRELFPIVDRLNKLLERVEAAVIREKALTADMAHELRTPLAGLRTATELALTRSRSPEEYQNTLRQSLDISIQMQDMVESLLMLARLEAGACAPAVETCQLDQMLARQLDIFGPRINSRHLTLDKKGIVPAEVLAPPELLLLVIRNILDNAVSYVDESGTIRLLLQPAADSVQLTVENTGSVIAAPQLRQVFERFWRGDMSRTDQGRHNGLGLSIVQNVMRQIGGTVRVESSADGWFTIELLFPKHGGDGSHDA